MMQYGFTLDSRLGHVGGRMDGSLGALAHDETASSTVTVTEAVPAQNTDGGDTVADDGVAAPAVAPPPTYTLILQPRPHISWDQAVVDNEFLGKKSSKRQW